MMDKDSILTKVEAMADWQAIVDNLKSRLGLQTYISRSKYVGIAKVKTQALLVAITHNLPIAANKIS